MKTITKTTAVRKADSSLDATLNPVELSSKEIVSWAIAFPRPGAGAPPVTRVEDSTPVQETRAALASNWVRDEKLEAALPNPPKITFGEVIARQTNGAVTATT
jgi:hypothetical protein